MPAFSLKQNITFSFPTFIRLSDKFTVGAFNSCKLLLIFLIGYTYKFYFEIFVELEIKDYLSLK